MATAKRGRLRREADMVVIERLYIQGVSQREIADILSAQRSYTLSRRQIRYDLEEILARWAEMMVVEREKHIVSQVKKLDRIEAEAWAGWERSKLSSEKLSSKKTQFGAGRVDGDGNPIPGFTRDEVGKETKKRDGDPKFLEIISKTVDQRSRLLNLYADGRFPFRDQATGITSFEDLVSSAVGYALEDRPIEMLPVPKDGSNGRNGGQRYKPKEEQNDAEMDEGTGDTGGD